MRIANKALLVLGVAALSPTGSAAEEPTPKLELKIDESGPQSPWKLTITNVGKKSAMLVADPALLWFEVRVPGKRKLTRCKLPKELFPKRARRRARLVLRPGEQASQGFDPRLYCFARGGQWQLVPGAFIMPHFGWSQKKKKMWRRGRRVTVAKSEPFVASTELRGEPEAKTSLKGLTGEPFALRSEYARWARTRLEEDRKQKPQPLDIKIVQGSDARAERTATVRISLKNRGKRNRYLYFRRELISFEVMGPAGLTTCDAQPDLRAPDRQAYSIFRKGRGITFTSRLVELCPRGTFSAPGLYLIHARLDATHSGEAYDLGAFVGRIISTTPGTIRIRTGPHPFLKTRRMRRGR